MRSCPDCDFLVPDSRSDCQQCGSEVSKGVQVLLVGAIAALVGIAAITVLGETVSGEFSNIYGSPLQANPQP